MEAFVLVLIFAAALILLALIGRAFSAANEKENQPYFPQEEVPTPEGLVETPAVVASPEPVEEPKIPVKPEPVKVPVKKIPAAKKAPVAKKAAPKKSAPKKKP